MQAPAYVNQLVLDTQMYSAADKYDLPRLRETAVEKFDEATWETNSSVRTFPEFVDKLLDQMIEAIPYIYNSIPDGDRCLRGRAILLVLWARVEFQKHPLLQDLMEAAPEFFDERRIKALRLPPRVARRPLSMTRCGPHR